MVTVKFVSIVLVIWQGQQAEASKCILNFISVVPPVQAMMREFLASGMCCLMIVHLKVVLYGNSFYLASLSSAFSAGEASLEACAAALVVVVVVGREGAVCLASVTWRNGLGLRFGFGVVHFPSRINYTRFHHKKIDVSVPM